MMTHELRSSDQFMITVDENGEVEVGVLRRVVGGITSTSGAPDMAILHAVPDFFI